MTITKNAIYFLRPIGFTTMKVRRLSRYRLLVAKRTQLLMTSVWHDL